MIRKLPDTELEVMQALWSCTVPATRADLEQILCHSHPMAQTTLLTILSRLAEKGFLRIEKESKAAHYYPLVEKNDYLAEQSRRFLDKLCGGNIATFASALCQSGLSKEDLDELRELLGKETK